MVDMETDYTKSKEQLIKMAAATSTPLGDLELVWEKMTKEQKDKFEVLTSVFDKVHEAAIAIAQFAVSAARPIPKSKSGGVAVGVRTKYEASSNYNPEWLRKQILKDPK